MAFPAPVLLYESGPCYAVHKPAGIATQAPPGIDSMEARMKDWLRVREHKSGNVYLGVPHRLDRPVSGVLLFARHVRAARRLADQFQRRSIRKTYWALVAGRVVPEHDTWTDWLRKVPDEPRGEVVPPQTADAKQAILHYHVVTQYEEFAWIEVTLETGRMHQIRVQAAQRGHAVLGDLLYGSNLPFGPPTDDSRAAPIALHARRLEFAHPMSGEPVTVTSPVPDPWPVAIAATDTARDQSR